MPVNRDLSSLPRASVATGEGWQPDPQPRFGHLLAEEWAAKNAEAKAHAVEGSRFRHSDAGACSRAIAYAALKVPESNPMDMAGHFIAEQGTLIHEALQAVLKEQFPGAEIEVKVGSEGWHSGHIDAVVRGSRFDEEAHLVAAEVEGYRLVDSGQTGSADDDGQSDWAVTDHRTGEVLASGHGSFEDLDAVWDERWASVDALWHAGWDAAAKTASSKTISIEIKSVDGYAYKLAVGERGPAQGPKWQHVLQAALNAAEVDADESVILYLARGAISIQAAQRKRIDPLLRFVAEWTQPREHYMPLAEVEIRRVQGILGLLDNEGMLPARKVPDPGMPRHVIVDPRKGSWVSHDDEGMVVDAGETWQCAYCRYQDLCVQTQAGRTPVAVLDQLGVPVDISRDAGD